MGERVWTLTEQIVLAAVSKQFPLRLGLLRQFLTPYHAVIPFYFP